MTVNSTQQSAKKQWVTHRVLLRLYLHPKYGFRRLISPCPSTNNIELLPLEKLNYSGETEQSAFLILRQQQASLVI